jgi:hypothetical protein
MFKDKPIIGHGVKSFREVCKEDSYKNFYGCATHPHNFYLQFLIQSMYNSMVKLLTMSVLSVTTSP